MAAPAISIRNLDHLGLVAALCQELGIARMIDALLPKTPPFKVSHGEALVAMIVNGLGFHSSTLHMFPQFFANKPVERLIGAILHIIVVAREQGDPEIAARQYVAPHRESAGR